MSITPLLSPHPEPPTVKCASGSTIHTYLHIKVVLGCDVIVFADDLELEELCVLIWLAVDGAVSLSS